MMTRTTLHIYAILLGLLFTSCNRDEGTSWDTNVLAPLAEARIGVEDLIPDSIMVNEAGTPVFLRIEFNENIIDKDSLLRIPDTVITDALSLPVSLTLPSGFEVADISQLIRFSYRDVLLTEAILEEGFAEISILNYLDDKILFDYFIPKATRNGQPLSVQGIEVTAGSYSQPTSFQLQNNLAGYTLDLRGDNLLQYNRLRYSLNATLNPEGNGSPVNANQAFVIYNNKFYGIKPYFARGYLGQTKVSFNDGTNLDYMKKIEGLIELEDIQLSILVENSVGADFVIQLNSITGKRENQTIALNHEIIGNELSFARAQLIPFNNQPFTPFTREIIFNQSNSNLKQFVEFLPHRIEFSIDAKLNPFGNVSSGNDFVYSNSNIRLKSVLELPLKFRAENLSFRDTIEFEGLNSAELDDVGEAELRLFAENGFPMDMQLEVYWLDMNKNLLSSSLINQTIAAASVGSDLKVNATQKTILNIPANAELKNHLEACRFVAFKTVFSTKPEQELLPIYADYTLKLQLIGDGTYTIRTNE